MGNMKRNTNVHLPAALRRRLLARVRRDGTDQATVIGEALTNYLKATAPAKRATKPTKTKTKTK